MREWELHVWHSVGGKVGSEAESIYEQIGLLWDIQAFQYEGIVTKDLESRP